MVKHDCERLRKYKELLIFKFVDHTSFKKRANFTIKLSITILKKHKLCHNFVIWAQKYDLLNHTIAAIKYELKYHNSRTSVERGQLVEDRLLPKPEDSGTRQSCILTIPEKNQIFYYSIVAVDQV